MKFLCVGYYDQEKMDVLTKAQIDAFMSQCPPFMEELYKSRKVLVMAGVGAEAKVLRRVNGEVEIADELISRHEMVGCVFLLGALDMADAVRVALLHPTTRMGEGEKLGFRIGISPVHYFEGESRGLIADSAPRER